MRAGSVVFAFAFLLCSQSLARPAPELDPTYPECSIPSVNPFEKFLEQIKLIVGLGTPQVPSSPPSPCNDWEKTFFEDQENLRGYKEAIEFALSELSGGVVPSCLNRTELDPGRSPQPDRKKYERRLELSNVPGLSSTIQRLGAFKYSVFPPRNLPKNGQTPKTVIIFAGGPGNVLSEVMEQDPNYQVIVADYLGMGQNSLGRVRPGVDDQDLNLDVYAKLMKLVIEKEKKDGGLGDYILQGHSFGSVGATTVGAYLSELPDAERDLKPTAVLLSGVVAFTDVSSNQPSSKASEPTEGIQWTPSVINKRLCILPQGKRCFDDSVLSLLSPSEQSAVHKKIAEMYKDFSPTQSTALQAFFRDAFHWVSASNPENAAGFLRKYLLQGNGSDLYCWYKSNFDQIPWLNRNTSPSMMASIDSLNCSLRGENPSCRCFSQSKSYDSSKNQIRSPVRILYVNGENDTQTPLAGAMGHFDLETNPNKQFLKICHGGHQLYGPPGVQGFLNPDVLYAAALNRDPQAFQNVSDSCRTR